MSFYRLHAFCGVAIMGCAFAARGAGPYGFDNGWAVDNSGHVLLTSSVAAKLSQAEAGWVRMEMRLFGSHTNWDSTILGYYDAAVNNARNAGLQVLLLIDGGSWPGGQSAWTQNNSENNPAANGDNAFVESYATNAVVPIVQHFRDRVKCYELWNEPNCWTSSPSSGVYAGATFLYPSNYGWLLTRSWEAVHIAQQITDVTLFSGGVFGHNIGGVTSYANAGAQYLDDTYARGTNLNQGGSFAHTKANYNAYPLDGVGQHLYLSAGGLVSSNTFRQYEDWVHQAITKYEGAGTPKKTFITEFGWQTTNGGNSNGVSMAIQDTNLATSFSTIQATPYVQTAIWFQWKDNPAGSLWYGVVDSSGNAKQSYADCQRFLRYEGVYANAATNTAIQNYFYALGQAALGSPYDNGGGPWVYTNLYGYAQDLAGGSHARLTILAATNGTFELNDQHGLWSFYMTNNGATAYGPWLDNELTFGDGTRQDFQQGYLTWDPISQVVWHQVNGTTLAITQNGILSWAGSSTLQSATNVAGPYLDVPGAASPYTIDTRALPQQCFRLRD